MWSMDAIYLILLGLVVIFLGVNGFLLWKQSGNGRQNEDNDVGFKLILQQVNELSRTVDEKMGETTRSMNDSVRNQFGESQKLIDKFLREVTNMTEKVTRVEETGKQMVNFADQLQNLQDILKNRNVETSKYIQPSKGTMDFAFMFIPHEAIYYDLLINKIGALKEETESLIQRAASKYKVIIVSPTSFLAYLQTVLQGLKAMQIEEQALDIVKRVGDLTTHLKKFAEKQDKLGKTIATVVNQYTDTSREFKKIDKDIVSITKADEALGYEPLILEKPEVDES